MRLPSRPSRRASRRSSRRQPQPARPRSAPLDLVGRRGREGGGQVDLAHWPGGPPRPGDPPGGSPGAKTPAFRARADSGHFEPPDPDVAPGAAAGSAGEGPSAPASPVPSGAAAPLRSVGCSWLAGPS